jgi:hypothetical protein
MGRPAEIAIEIIAYERPRRFAESIRMPTMDIRGGLAFDPVPTATRMRWSWDLMPRGVHKLMAPLVARLGKRQEQRDLGGPQARHGDAGGALSGRWRVTWGRGHTRPAARRPGRPKVPARLGLKEARPFR